MTDQAIKQIRIELMAEPGGEPHEAVTWNVPDDLSAVCFASGDEMLTLEAHVAGFIASHLRGECPCVEATQ